MIPLVDGQRDLGRMGHASARARDGDGAGSRQRPAADGNRHGGTARAWSWNRAWAEAHRDA